MWKKLTRLQLVIRRLSKPLVGIMQQIEKVMHGLCVAQQMLVQDRMNKELIA